MAKFKSKEEKVEEVVEEVPVTEEVKEKKPEVEVINDLRNA